MVKNKVVTGIILLSFISAIGFSQTDRKQDFSNLFSPDVIKMDIDHFTFIANGVVAIKKGTQEALIDLKGNFVLNWGKYIYYSYNFLWGDLIRIHDPVSRTNGFVNSKGVLVIPNEEGTYLSHFGLSPVNIKGPNEVFNQASKYDVFLREVYTQKQYSNRMLLEHLVDVTDTTAANEYTRGKSGKMGKLKDGRNTMTYKKTKYGYGNKFGKMLLSVNYDIARHFTDDRAAVMKIDAFGVEKWGFIDTIGTLVIPLMFKNEPGYFHDGLALVEPSDKTSFQYAYIDKMGEIKIKIGSSEKKEYYEPLGGDGLTKKKYLAPAVWVTELVSSGYFINGYSFWKREGKNVVLNTAGKFFTLDEFANKPEMALDDTGLQLIRFDELGIYFATSSFSRYKNNRGLIDYNKVLRFPPLFNGIDPDYYSSYALVEYDLGFERKPQYGSKLEGVVNKDGKFLIIREKKEVF